MISHPQLDRIISLETIDSTNLELKRRRQEFRGMNVLMVSDEQRAGRGQKGRSWDSARGKGLWMSLHLGRPDALAYDLGLLSLYTGLVVWRMITPLLSQRVELKWPNDILIDSRKCGGILTELQWQGEQVASAIIGVGINIYHVPEDFQGSLKGIATSLGMEGAQSTTREELVNVFLDTFFGELSLLNDGERLASSWNTKAYMMEQTVELDTSEGVMTGVFTGINSQGEACVQIGNLVQTFQTGELRLLKRPL